MTCLIFYINIKSCCFDIKSDKLEDSNKYHELFPLKLIFHPHPHNTYHKAIKELWPRGHLWNMDNENHYGNQLKNLD